MASDSTSAFGQGLRRERAANYVGVSPSKFDDWVSRKIMPRPRRVDGCVLWLREELDAALFALPDGQTDAERSVWADLAT
jgi:predicted DNA-binding transcriptional regulator AlpA